MTPETLKLFRINLLLQLRAGGQMGMTVNELMQGVRAQGFTGTEPETVREELAYLLDKGQAVKLDAEISPEIESFRATAAGRDWLATQNL